MQRYALSASHFGEFGERKDDQLAIVADCRDAVMACRNRADDGKFRAWAKVYDLPPFAGLGNQIGNLGHKPAPVGRRQQQFGFRARRQQLHDANVAAQIDHQSHRLAKAAPAGELVCRERVKPPIRCCDKDFIGRLGMDGKGRAIAFLELGGFGTGKVGMPLQRADPALR